MIIFWFSYMSLIWVFLRLYIFSIVICSSLQSGKREMNAFPIAFQTDRDTGNTEFHVKPFCIYPQNTESNKIAILLPKRKDTGQENICMLIHLSCRHCSQKP